MQWNSRFLRILSVFLLAISLCGCNDAGRETADPNERYAFIIDMIREQEVFSDRSDYFDIAVEMAKIDGGYRYYITLDNPRIAMYDVELLAIEDGTSLISALIAVGACKSNREARDLIKGSSISVNGEKVNDLNYVLNASDAFNGSLTILKKGKKFYYAVEF